MEIQTIKNKMNNAMVFFEKELSSIRTSRANTSMLDNIMVDSYGSKTPLNQLGNISVPDATTLTIQIWDTSLIKAIENAINDSNLGINPQTDGNLVRLPVQKLSTERRNELSKVASQYGENAKISIRNIRREGLDILKNDEKSKTISQDESKKIANEVQKITDEHIKKIDEVTMLKKSELLKV